MTPGPGRRLRSESLRWSGLLAACLLTLIVTGLAQASATASPAGHRWQLRHVDPPEALDAQLIYDPAASQTLLFGGYGTSSPNPPANGAWNWDETLVWNGNAWSRAWGAHPTGRRQAGLVYDAAGRRVILFGGWGNFGGPCDFNNAPTCGDTWAWDGRRWTQLATTGPLPRYLASMAYDPATREVVLYGGYTADQNGNPTLLGDTWIWHGNRWYPATTAGPRPRAGAALVYDPVSHSLLLVGGLGAGGQALGDSWRWTGRSWANTRFELPPRENAAVTYDSVRRQVLLFGGDTGTRSPVKYLGDTWAWDGRRWAQRHSGLGAGDGPGPRTRSSIAFDTATGQAVLFGGANTNGDVPGTWLWDGVRWARSAARGPALRQGAAMVYDAARRRLLMLGGLGHAYPFSYQLGAAADYPGDTWTWDGRRWMNLSGPEGSRDALSAYDAATRQVVLLVGHSPGKDLDFLKRPYPATTYVWNGSSWARVSGSQPLARAGASMVYDEATRQLVLFGGSYGSPTQYLGDTWIWSGSGWSRAAGGGPPARAGANAVYDAATRRVVLFGGCCQAGGVPFGDTWTWNGRAWSQAGQPPSGSPTPRTGASMAYDPRSRRVVLFGGQTGDVSQPTLNLSAQGAGLGDTWTFDGSAWQPMTAAPAGSGLPAPRWDASLVYDTARSRLVLFGGSAGGGQPAYLGDTWTWDGLAWTLAQQTPPLGGGPGGRALASATFDPAVGRIVLWGGFGQADPAACGPGVTVYCTAYLNDTWTWDGRTWSKIAGGPPAAGSSAVSCGRLPLIYDAATGQLVMYGGYRDTWTL